MYPNQTPIQNPQSTLIEMLIKKNIKTTPIPNKTVVKNFDQPKWKPLIMP